MRRAKGRSAARAACLLILLLAVALVGAGAAQAGTYTGELAFGPNGRLKTLGNVDIAPDGTGAMVYLVEEDGADHVFVTRLVDGAWLGPERIDAAHAGPSSQPVVAAADGGRVTVVYVNGGNVYAATRASTDGQWTEQTVWGGGGASDPHVDLSVNRKGYLAFAAPGAGGHDVRVAFSRDAGPWTLIDAPLDANPAADAGVGTGRVRVGAAGDGVAVVVWGEAGRVYARRVMGTRPSVVVADAIADARVEGVEAIGGDLPEVGIQDDDSFTGVAFRAFFPVADPARPRALYRRLRGSRFEWTAVVDGTTFGSGEGSGGARIATIGVGQGLVVGTNDVTHVTHALALRADVAPADLLQVDAAAASTAPTYAVPAASTALKRYVAWQFTGPDGATEVRGRFFNGTAFEAEETLSVPSLGQVDAARGLDAAADDHGDMVIAWVQGAGIAVATIDQPPGRISLVKRPAGFERTTRPVLRWTRSREAWGARYRVAIDGVEVATTPRLAYRPKTPLAQGVHTWQVTVVDRRGQTFASKQGTLRIDTVAPRARIRISGARRPRATLTLRLNASDAPGARGPDGRAIPTSGVRDAIVDWGDRTRRVRTRAIARHAYARPGRYRVRVTVLDRAGNRAVVSQVVRVARRGGGRR